MGYIASSTTVYATAYLTDTGRNYLFNKNNIRFNAAGQDLFAITQFTLGDSDTNYAMNYILQTGQVPDVSGNADQCLKTADDAVNSIMLYWQFNALSFVTPIYTTSLASNDNILSINTDISSNFPLNNASDHPPVSIVATPTSPLVSSPSIIQ